MRLGSVCSGGVGHPGLVVFCTGHPGQGPPGCGGFEVSHVCLWPLSCLPSSMYQTKAVIIAMIITAVVSISVTIFCFQTKVRVEGPSLATLLPFLVHSWPLKVALEQAWEGPEDFP